MADVKVFKLTKDHKTLGKKGTEIHLTSKEQEAYFEDYIGNKPEEKKEEKK